jgi:AraC-like DNA-binding protein
MVGKGNRIRVGSGAPGIERLEAHLHGQAFAPHRHDTYAIGVTLRGVQRFRFRGAQWQCLPGECHILHPDELHDGGAGTEEGFGYRIVYIDPALVQAALPGWPLPFVAQPVMSIDQWPDLDLAELWDFDAQPDDLAGTQLVAAAVGLLTQAADGRAQAPGALALDRLLRVRELIAATPTRNHSMAELERLAGLDRWTLARQFRAAFGTSPSRFRTLRRLDWLRGSLKRGVPLADAALDAGFADQSHMSRQFKLAYGLTPARWLAALV